MSSPPLFVLVLISVVLLVESRREERALGAESQALLIVFLIASLLHAQFDLVGWPFRYEAYLIALGLVGWAAYSLLFTGAGANAETRLLSGTTTIAGVSGGVTLEGASGFRLCNKTASRVGVAIGYKEGSVWTTEGWWNVSGGACETLMPGPLVSRPFM